MDSTTGPIDRRPIGFWLKLVDRLIDESFDALLGQEALTRRHWQVLNVLQPGPATAAQVDAKLAPFLDDDEPTARGAVDDLSARCWASWADDGNVALTAAGMAAHTELLARVSENRRRLTQNITPEAYLQVVDNLRQMALNLGWVDPDGRL